MELVAASTSSRSCCRCQGVPAYTHNTYLIRKSACVVFMGLPIVNFGGLEEMSMHRGTQNVRLGFLVHHADWRNKRFKKRVARYLQLRLSFTRKPLCIHNWWTPVAGEGGISTLEQDISHIDCAPGALYPSLSIGGSGSPCTRGAESYLSLDSSPPFATFHNFCSFVETHQGPLTAIHEDEHEIYTSTGIIFTKLQQCIDDRDLAAGREVHWLIIKCGFESDAFLGSHLIRMFAYFESLSEANQVFLRLPNPSVYSWSAIILAHVKLGQNGAALQLYHEMHKSCIEPDGHIFVGALKTCINLADIGQGKLVHAQVIEYGFEFDDFVGSALVEMYSRYGSPKDARMVFDRMPKRRAITCSLLIAGYVQQGSEEIALELFKEILQEGIQLDEVTYISILKACSSISALNQGRKIHAHLIESGLEWDIYVGNALIDMYVKCESLQEADAMFHRLPMQDVVTWTAMIGGYAQQGFGDKALHFFEAMQQHGMDPNPITLVLILRACSNIASLEQGRKVHARIIESGAELDEFAGSSLIDMYGKCGSLEDAGTMFERMPRRNVITWSAFIARFAEHGHGQEAGLLFEQMQQEGVSPDKVSFICILKACCSAVCLEHGRLIHRQIVESGFGMDVFLGNSLIDMYVKCESLGDACTLSNRLPEQNVVTWSVLIGGYVQQGFALEAIQIFDKMNQEGVELDEISFVCALKACSSIAALKQGRQIHGKIIENGYESDKFLSSTLIDMYAKCGNLEDARRAFERLSKKTVVTWSALMSGYAQNGDYMSVVRYFEGMQQAGLEPDDVSFLSLLAGCSHRGLLEKGCAHFKSMRNDHGIAPTIKHHNSMVDILGHAGCLNEVEDLLETIPFQRNLVGWTSLLTSCRSHYNVNIGRRSFDNFSMMDRGNATGYVLMENIYSQVGMWEDAEEIEELRRYANGWKKPGKAFIEIGDQVHDFIVGDKTHPQSSAIYAKLESLSFQMREEGYKPRVDLVLDTLSEDDKEDALCGHCEKLAIAFGLICTAQGTTIRVSKNLRMCADCHNVTKMISKLEMREIVVVDAYCIHRFQDGACSCPENV